MPYTESEITRDFDRLSLLSEGTPVEKISGYSLTFSPRKEKDIVMSKPARTIGGNDGHVRSFDYEDDDSFSSSTSSSASDYVSPRVLGRGRGKIIVPHQGNIIERCEFDHHLEKEMRLAIPLGYSNELIEHHYAHHLEENQPQAVAAPAETTVPISSNNVALLSLSRNAKKRVKKIVNPCQVGGLVLDDKNFPKLK